MKGGGYEVRGWRKEGRSGISYCKGAIRSQDHELETNIYNTGRNHDTMYLHISSIKLYYEILPRGVWSACSIPVYPHVQGMGWYVHMYCEYIELN